jgi:hypothetical protein
MGTACKKNELKEEEKEKICDVENPLTDLLWLKEITDGFELDTKVWGYAMRARIYQCTYKDGIGFLLEMCVGCSNNPFYPEYSFRNCEGVVLCEEGRRYSEENNCTEFNIDFQNKKLIWDGQPDPPITVDNLYDKSLPVIQKCVQGKWELYKLWDGDYLYYNNTFVDISENRVVISGDDMNYTFSYSWKKMEVHTPPQPGMPNSYTTFVMWNDEQNRGEWSFYELQKDFLFVNKYDRSGVYTLKRIRNYFY